MMHFIIIPFLVREGHKQIFLANCTKKNSSKHILMMGNKQLLIVPVTFASGGLQFDPGNNLSGESNRGIERRKIIHLEVDAYRQLPLDLIYLSSSCLRVVLTVMSYVVATCQAYQTFNSFP
ncbi:hypothetical protein AVEN_79831-1 [Araneus ventricosus]|uniref:Uncharacterized protein n=1 Tax=Araneus ventricosus TaxID=182803 RepID=A0A4Y2F078_ARAVE|nr:hypothetical protein AVEN_79831-1 [Araneus ventricosus]